ncbi:hypothetical protein FVEN_g11492 [Fusarium venenatum]|uniref:Uncharacterized protein n=1 Tax=Fusarium venenatum TaxID=56646 RepID=A0A2L2TUJ5_9HYPO|nr:uncharacterized protein FVRRES_01612 [Fusarium venenatum]KAG8350345.1 hypothetical protein FVEN_g11492 [Fusarium venenatum]CEI65100.1 unnamed protein product [Fusarium venenatum]
MAPRRHGSPGPNVVFLPLTAIPAPCSTNFKDKGKNKIHRLYHQFDSPTLTLPHLASSRLASHRLDQAGTYGHGQGTVRYHHGWLVLSAAPQISLVQVDFGLRGFRAV